MVCKTFLSHEGAAGDQLQVQLPSSLRTRTRTRSTLRCPCPCPCPCPRPQLDDKSGNAAFSLRKLYEKLLRPFDDYCQERAEGGYGLLGELARL